MENDERQSRLWTVVSKLHGIAALIKNWNGEPLASNNDSHDAIHGLGMIIEDLANEVKVVWTALDDRKPDPHGGQNNDT